VGILVVLGSGAIPFELFVGSMVGRILGSIAGRVTGLCIVGLFVGFFPGEGVGFGPAVGISTCLLDGMVCVGFGAIGQTGCDG
jgi:hypothetical protein